MTKRIGWILSLLCVPAACSLVNAPDDPIAPSDDQGGAGATGGQGGTGGEPPECVGDAQCASLSDECNDGVCSNGSCQVVPKDDGTACGDPSESSCDAPDTCVAGVCAPNLAGLGTPCTDCPAGAGQCAGCQDGLCADCGGFAAVQTFVHESALDGWELTGDWGLYQEAPRNVSNQEPVDFPGLVFGTDGNRSQPYPGGELEESYARTKPFTVPATLQFSSWHVDEGTIDWKTIRLSVDGGNTWTPLADCNAGAPLNAFPFCQSVGDGRLATDWDAITIDVPVGMVGEEGIVEFGYDTQDGCCSFERGWYLTELNFATGCACQDASACGWADSECATASCHGSGECRLTSVGAGTACGDAGESECDNPDTCDAFGYCRTRAEFDGIACYDCKGGVDDCRQCSAGTCLECMNLPAVNDFNSFSDIAAWERTGGWNRYTSAPVSQTYTAAVNFPSGVFGTDGNRVPPYPGNETETSYARTPPFVVPSEITFQSWHVDEGSGADTKQLRLSTDGGMTWTAIVDCQVAGLNAYPFCMGYNQNRLANQWDSIVVDTSAFAGQIAILELTYNTFDSCCDFERGWFIDDLNVARRCLD